MTPGVSDMPLAEGGGAVFVTGIWKSGNHLVYSALNEMGVAGPFNGFAAHLLFGRHAWAKRLLRGAFPWGEGLDVGLETSARVRPGYLHHSLRQLRGRITGGHAAFSPGLLALLKDEGARIVVIRRDPRDVLVSFADWIGSRPDFYLHPAFAPLGREDRIALLLRGGPCGGFVLNPFDRVLDLAVGWLAAPGALQVRFEDLIGPEGGGSAVAQRNQIERLHAFVRPPKPLAEVEAGRIYGGTLTFNKGRAARWRELGNPRLIDQINDRIGPRLKDWGYGE